MSLSTSSTSSALQHLSFACPVDRRITVYPTSLKEFLGRVDKIQIPLFQRRYCWKMAQLEGWWKDLIYSSEGHSIGKLVFAQEDHRQNQIQSSNDNKQQQQQEVLMVIDGQQRLTTSCLFWASLRDVLLTYPPQQHQDVLNTVDNLLFTSSWMETKRECQSHIQDQSYAIPYGKVMESIRFIPSYPDRSAFYQLLTHKHIGHEEKEVLKCNYNREADMFLIQTKSFFDKKISSFLNNNKNNGRNNIMFLLRKSLGFKMMYVQCQPDIDLPQFFLWLQEKTLFGMGVLLYNPSPGEHFQLCDMVRNFLLSNFVSETNQLQEEFYQSHWLELEQKFPRSSLFSQFLTGQIKQQEKASMIPMGKLEQTMREIMKMLQVDPETRCDAIYYAKFVAIFDNRLLKEESSQLQNRQLLSRIVLEELIIAATSAADAVKN